VPFDLADFVRRRPTCVHRTHVDNVAGIEAIRELWPAADLYKSAGKRRPKQRRQSYQDLFLQCEFGRLRVNDQDPFHERHGRFERGWTADRFREELDRRVFFWPTRQSPDGGNGASGQAAAFLRKYSERSVLVIVPTADLLAANDALIAEFSRCNSGTLSPRTRKYNVRGPMTFLPPQKFVGTLADVKEIVFRGRVRLPQSMRLIPAVAFG
jgi:hypothetical protein